MGEEYCPIDEYLSLEKKCILLVEKYASKELQKKIIESKNFVSNYRAPIAEKEKLNASSIPSGEQLWLASVIDHTILRANTTEFDIEKLCGEAREFQFATVCVHPIFISQCKRLLENTTTKVITVVGFPLGSNTTKIKKLETQTAIESGATEIDTVIHVGSLRTNRFDEIFFDIQSIVEIANPFLVKVIIESASLSDEEKIIASWISKAAGAHFVKTSTGFSPAGGATTRDIALIRHAVGPYLGVKASGGIKNTTEALSMLAAGADRIGSSSSKDIVLGKYV